MALAPGQWTGRGEIEGDPISSHNASPFLQAYCSVMLCGTLRLCAPYIHKNRKILATICAELLSYEVANLADAFLWDWDGKPKEATRAQVLEWKLVECERLPTLTLCVTRDRNDAGHHWEEEKNWNIIHTTSLYFTLPVSLTLLILSPDVPRVNTKLENRCFQRRPNTNFSNESEVTVKILTCRFFFQTIILQTPTTERKGWKTPALIDWSGVVK